MVWKCPKCKYTTTSHTAMMRHFYREHYTKKGKSVPKGKDKKKHIFHPPVNKKRRK